MHHPPQTKQQHLRDLVYEKNLWDEPLSEADKTKGFLGWHERGYLPHCDKPGLVQLVTFRLADSMPITKRGEWEHLLKIEDNKEKRNQLEAYLDRGDGECYLRNPRIAQIAESALLHFHQQQYELLAWCVMPNHVHVLVHIWEKPLYKIIQSWKRYSATKALQALRLERRFLNRRDYTDMQTHEPNQNSALQSFWQREYWDTFMRDKDQERTAIRYIENNPTKSKLSRLPEDWPFSSTRFRDDYAQLKLPPP